MGSPPSNPKSMDFGKMKSMLHCAMDNMCAHKKAYKCMHENAGVCSPGDGVQSQSSPARMGKYVDCICDSCPGLGPTLSNMQIAMMEIMTQASSDARSNTGSAATSPSQEQMTALYTSICPFVTASTCIKSNTATCKDLVFSLPQVKNVQNISALQKNCTAMGVSTTYSKSLCIVDATSPATQHGLSLFFVGLFYLVF